MHNAHFELITCKTLDAASWMWRRENWGEGTAMLYSTHRPSTLSCCTQAYISPSAAMQQLQTGVTRYHDIVVSLWALSRYHDPTNFHDSSPIYFIIPPMTGNYSSDWLLVSKWARSSVCGAGITEMSQHNSARWWWMSLLYVSSSEVEQIACHLSLEGV